MPSCPPPLKVWLAGSDPTPTWRKDKSNRLRLAHNKSRWRQPSRVRKPFARWRQARPGLSAPVWWRFKCGSPSICKTPAQQIYSGGILNYGNGEGVGVLVQQTSKKLKGKTQWKQGERLNLCAVFFIDDKNRLVYSYADKIRTAQPKRFRSMAENTFSYRRESFFTVVFDWNGKTFYWNCRIPRSHLQHKQ